MLEALKIEGLKKAVERATGWRRPTKDEIPNLIRKRKAHLFRFTDDGVIPNHPAFPVVLYRGALKLPAGLDPAAVIEDVFQQHGWGGRWRGGIYDYVHYHSRTHEVLAVARGVVKVRLGGARGRSFSLKPGDAVVLPAGTGHQCLGASKDFLTVGAYPPKGVYDECTTSEQRKQALKTIRKVARPRKDPIYGAAGPLIEAWPVRRRRNKSR